MSFIVNALIWSVVGPNKPISKHTHTCAQCSHASVGLSWHLYHSTSYIEYDSHLTSDFHKWHIWFTSARGVLVVNLLRYVHAHHVPHAKSCWADEMAKHSLPPTAIPFMGCALLMWLPFYSGSSLHMVYCHDMIKPSPLVWFPWCLPPSSQPSVSTAQPSVPSAQPSVHWGTKIGISDAVTKVQNVMMSGASLTFFCTLAMHQNCDNYLVFVHS